MSNTNTALVKRREELRAVLYAPAAVQELQKALPVSLGIEPERFLRQVMTMAQKNPSLMTCTPGSIYAGVIQAAELGLELAGPLGQAWLVPRYNKRAKAMEATFQVGYKGYIALAFRSNQVRRFTPRVVYAKDYFSRCYGLLQDLQHVPGTGDRGEAIHYYAVIELTNGGTDFADMSKAEVVAHRLRFSPPPDGKPDYSAWATNFDVMAMKTCCAALGRRAPVATELHRAASVDAENEFLASPLAPEASDDEPDFSSADLLEDKLSEKHGEKAGDKPAEAPPP